MATVSAVMRAPVVLRALVMPRALVVLRALVVPRTAVVTRVAALRGALATLAAGRNREKDNQCQAEECPEPPHEFSEAESPDHGIGRRRVSERRQSQQLLRRSKQ
jgi:hypothetical protein